MWENQKHRLNYALIDIDLTYLTEMRSQHVVTLHEKNIDLTNM